MAWREKHYDEMASNNTARTANSVSPTIEVPTAGTVLPNGVVLELMRSASNRAELGLLCWQNGTARFGNRVNCQGATYVPVDLGPSDLAQLPLPTRIAAQESPRELFRAIRNLFSDCLGQPESFTTILASIPLVSWTSDALPMIPSVWVNTTPTSPKFTTLGLLRGLCRHSLLLSGVRRTDFQHLPWHLKPTLILDEPDPQPSVQRLLLSSARRDVCTVTRHRLTSFYGCKIIFSRKLPDEALFQGDCLKLSLMPPGSRTTVLDENAERQIMEEFQARLLGFRLRHLQDLTAPKLDFGSLTSPGQDLARALATAVAGDGELVQLLLPLLTERDNELRIDRSSTFDAVLIESLLAFDHEGVREIRAEQLAERVNHIFAGRGSARTVSAEEVGWKLKNLQIPKKKIGSAGNGVKFTDAVRRLVHELAASHEVLTFRAGPRTGCTACERWKVSP